MNKPKMILFDYGHTLCNEADFDGVRGMKAVLRHAVANKNNIGAEDLNAHFFNLYDGIAKDIRNAGAELHNLICEKFMYEYLQIAFDMPPVLIERIFWDNAAPGVPMANAGLVLDYLKSHGIRSGVISNISFCGANLANRIGELFPGHMFEFIIASSEYIYRKPHVMLFELALRKADLPAEDVWFCGDSTKHDLDGARSAGIFPVWYHSHIECGYRDKSTDVRPEYEHLYIRDWLELIKILDGLPL